jgi:hypothetical protein
MNLPLSFPRGKAALLMCLALLLACSPTYNWRAVNGAGAPYTVMLPAKPTSHSRKVDLGGTEVAMTMMAAEVKDTSFAVATAELPDAAQAQAALATMKKALIRNIGGTVGKEKTASAGGITTLEFEASGPQHALFAKLVAKERRVYQVLVVGKPASLTPEVVDTFLSSFKPA